MVPTARGSLQSSDSPRLCCNLFCPTQYGVCRAMNFSDIYGQYAKHVYRFALFLSGNSSLAEDLTSETFVNALCGPTNLKLGTVKAYLFAITRNLYRDSIRN